MRLIGPYSAITSGVRDGLQSAPGDPSEMTFTSAAHSQRKGAATGVLFTPSELCARQQVAHNRQYALPTGGVRRQGINDLKSIQSDANGSSATDLAASGNRHSVRD